MKTVRVTFRCLVAAILLVAASACSPLLPRGEPDTIWQLPQQIVSANAASGKALQWQLRVAAPRAPGLLAGSRIVVLPEPGQLSVYQGARWSQPAPELWRDRLLGAFHANGRLEAVSGDDANLHANLELGGVLEAFQVEYRDGKPVAVIRYHARLVDPRSNRIIAHRSFSAAQATAGNKVPAAVAALGALADQISAEVVTWTLAEGARYRRDASAAGRMHKH